MKVQSKQGKMFLISEIEEKLERFELNERKLEDLYTRVDSLKKLKSKDRSGNSELDVVRSEEPSKQHGNSQEQQVWILINLLRKNIEIWN